MDTWQKNWAEKYYPPEKLVLSLIAPCLRYFPPYLRTGRALSVGDHHFVLLFYSIRPMVAVTLCQVDPAIVEITPKSPTTIGRTWLFHSSVAKSTDGETGKTGSTAST
jgi:hypothetical protein